MKAEFWKSGTVKFRPGINHRQVIMHCSQPRIKRVHVVFISFCLTFLILLGVMFRSLELASNHSSLSKATSTDDPKLTTFIRPLLGLCTRVREEESYLYEWISFYLNQGVTVFYIYYDESGDDTLRVLRHLQSKLPAFHIYNVTSLPDHETGQQPEKGARHSFRDHCLKENPESVQWLLMVDVDEFVFVKTLKPKLRTKHNQRQVNQDCMS